MQKVKIYDPIKFFYDGILGREKQTQAQQNNQYQWNNYNILIPKYANTYQYLLYHTPVIYNWIEKIQTQQTENLKKYVNQKSNDTSKSIKAFNVQRSLKEALNQYAKKWEIAKICFQGQFYIKSADCVHLSKRSVYSLNYKFSFKQKGIKLETYFCQKCNVEISIESQNSKLPEILILSKYEQKLSEYLNIPYELEICISSEKNNEAFIKVINGVWYQVKSQHVKMVGLKDVLKNKNEYYCYRRIRKQNLPNDKPLLITKPIKSDQAKKIKIEPSIPIFIQQQQPEKIKQKQSIRVPSKIYNKLKPLPENKLYKIETYDGDKQTYEDNIKKLYPKEKQKDQYDKQYDAGKVKKIKKKIQKHKVNFFEEYVHKFKNQN